MRHAIGFVERGNERAHPLLPQGRMKFDTSDFRTRGYFDLIAPGFESYAQRDAHTTIHTINVLMVLEGSDLTDALCRLDELEANIARRPEAWREFLGTVHPPRGAPAVRIEPLLFRSRAQSVLRKLRDAVEGALANDWRMVYGNGVAYRHLLGIKLPPGVVEYS